MSRTALQNAAALTKARNTHTQRHEIIIPQARTRTPSEVIAVIVVRVILAGLEQRLEHVLLQKTQHTQHTLGESAQPPPPPPPPAASRWPRAARRCPLLAASMSECGVFTAYRCGRVCVLP